MSWKLPANYRNLVATPSGPHPFKGMGLTERLAALVLHVDVGSRIVDVGTDHGLLPIALVASKRASTAIAVDISSRPLTIARKNVSKFKLHHKIDLRLGNGLSVIKENEVDTAIIAGMSGERMAEILTRDDLASLGIKKLIVQPNTNQMVFRQRMAEAGWEIVDESMVACGQRSYVIMVLKPAHSYFTLTLDEAILGPILSKSPDNLLYKLWLELMVQRSAQKVRGYETGHPDNLATLENARKRWEVFNEASRKYRAH